MWVRASSPRALRPSLLRFPDQGQSNAYRKFAKKTAKDAKVSLRMPL